MATPLPKMVLPIPASENGASVKNPGKAAEKRKKRRSKAKGKDPVEVPASQPKKVPQKVTSLTATQDRPKDFVYQPSPKMTLSNKQTAAALKTNTASFPRLEQVWMDPPYRNNRFVSVSFVPCQGAKPDKKGMFGMLKVRGVYETDQEQKDHAESIVRNIDSYHIIAQGEVGRPLPIGPDLEGLCRSVNAVDIKDHAVDTISKDIKTAREKERAAIEEVKAQERKLVEKAENEQKSGMEPMEHYIQLQVKRSNLIYAVIETLKRIKEYKASITSCVDAITEMDTKHPTYKSEYVERYKGAAHDAGIDDSDNNILRYMMKPCPFNLEDDLNLTMIQENDQKSHQDLKDLIAKEKKELREKELKEEVKKEPLHTIPEEEDKKGEKQEEDKKEEKPSVCTAKGCDDKSEAPPKPEVTAGNAAVAQFMVENQELVKTKGLKEALKIYDELPLAMRPSFAERYFQENPHVKRQEISEPTGDKNPAETEERKKEEMKEERKVEEEKKKEIPPPLPDYTPPEEIGPIHNGIEIGDPLTTPLPGGTCITDLLGSCSKDVLD